jgi:ribosomal protein L4
MRASQVAVADVIGHQSLVISESALEQLEERAKDGKR